MRFFSRICFGLFGITFSAIVSFYLFPLLVKFNFPNMDIAAIWFAIIKCIVFVIGIAATLAWLITTQGKGDQQ